MANLYFMKLNIQSKIFDVYDDYENMDKILNLIYDSLSDTDYKMEYETTYFNKKKKEKQEQKQEFQAHIFNTDSNKKTVAGDFRRYITTFLNEENEEGKLVAVPHNDIEGIRFYFDIRSEVICFYRGGNFGYRQFQKFFGLYLNKLIDKKAHIHRDEEEETPEHITLEFIRSGSGIEEFYSELLDFGIVTDLSFDITAPNASEEHIKNILNVLGKDYEDYKKAGITKSTSSIKSNTEKGLNIKDGIIKEEIERLKFLNNDIKKEEDTEDDEEEIGVDYVKLTAINNKGNKLESQKKEMYVRKIEETDKNEYKFLEISKTLVNIVTEIISR